MTFPLTALTDQDNPNLSTESVSIPINITDDNIFEGLEYFQAKIVKTSDPIRVRIGRDTVNVTIMDDDSESSSRTFYSSDIFLQIIQLDLTHSHSSFVP